MNANPRNGAASRIQGSLLRPRGGREVAIYLRDGVPWIAEFQDGSDQVFAASEWMSVDGRKLAYAQRRGELESESPIPADVMVRIERLHRRFQGSRSNAVVRALAQIVGARPAGYADSPA